MKSAAFWPHNLLPCSAGVWKKWSNTSKVAIVSWIQSILCLNHCGYLKESWKILDPETYSWKYSRKFVWMELSTCTWEKYWKNIDWRKYIVLKSQEIGKMENKNKIVRKSMQLREFSTGLKNYFETLRFLTHTSSTY